MERDAQRHSGAARLRGGIVRIEAERLDLTEVIERRPASRREQDSLAYDRCARLGARSFDHEFAGIVSSNSAHRTVDQNPKAFVLIY